MQYTLLLSLFATTTLVSSQSISDIPSCAASCLGTTLTATGCPLTDVKCICASDLIANITPCVKGACTTAELNSTISYAQNVCLAAGVTISVPPSASSTASGASGAAASGTSSGGGASGTSATASGASGSPSGAATSSSASNSSTTTGESTVTGAKTSSSTTTGAASTSSAAASAGYKNAGSAAGMFIAATIATAGLGTFILL